ncbi:hypothetical protein PR048_007488 [Dryococelus australis]|uniref:Endonuclease/exonuclease/phosphatase domain-containing protein n=1 Tax=Dryococelus australis TaxID=614101 RepID=A0ABQ9HUE0_9NEOP|nr:hypothetical protein PR048_007488 [Dryococelus australis]
MLKPLPINAKLFSLLPLQSVVFLTHLVTIHPTQLFHVIMINFIIWNARSVVHKLDDIAAVLHHQPIIFGITETWLKLAYQLSHLWLHGALHRQRTFRSRWLRCDILHYSRTIRTSAGLEAAAVRITDVHPPFTFVIVYNLPRGPFPSNSPAQLLTLDASIILAGDINGQNTAWGCHTTTFRGKGLQKFVDYNYLSLSAPNTPTHHPSTKFSPFHHCFLHL